MIVLKGIINSLIKHIDELDIVLSNQCVDILAINETKLDGSICDNEVTVESDKIIRRGRSANGRFGGGICFYIRSNINYFCGRSSYLTVSKCYQSKFANLVRSHL